MTIAISGAQRDAIYGRILDRLSGVGDIALAVNSGDFASADRLAREYADELLLVSGDLGWGEGEHCEPVQLKAPSDLLGRIFGRLQISAASEREAHAASWEEGRRLDEQNRLVDETCAAVLRELELAS